MKVFESCRGWGILALTVRAKGLSLAIGIALLLLGGLCLPSVLSHRQRSPIDTSVAAFEQLRLGMTEGEVEAVVGGPAGKYTSGQYLGALFVASAGIAITPPDDYEKEWVTDEGTISVRFSKSGKAVRIEHGLGFIRESWTDKVSRNVRYVLPLPDDPACGYRLP